MATRTRNPRGEGARLRDEIVAAAMALLDEPNDTVTLRSVARRAGIAAPSIYRHFPDQPAIMHAVVRQAFAELETTLTAATTAADPRLRLFAVCARYLTFAQHHPDRYRTMFDGPWAALAHPCVDLLRDALAACVAAGHSASTDPTTDGTALWLGLHGLANHHAVTGAPPGPRDLAQRMISALAHLTDT